MASGRAEFRTEPLNLVDVKLHVPDEKNLADLLDNDPHAQRVRQDLLQIRPQLGMIERDIGLLRAGLIGPMILNERVLDIALAQL